MGNTEGVYGEQQVTALRITSSDPLSNIEHHFRVTAGPGAGKTYWLAGHIRHVARISKRLGPCSKICVISYTNVAVREIVSRLGPSVDVVEASTIHSFLFRNVVRPYVHLLRSKDGKGLVAHQHVDTHGEHFPAYDVLSNWLRDCKSGQMLARKKSFELLKSRLRALTVRIDASGTAYFSPSKSDGRDKAIQKLLTPDCLLDYKARIWAKGTIDHEDVLYLAYRLLSEHPILRQFLSAKYPYIFIDEFQDTLPVQAALVKWFAAEKSVVGVIGDPEQAIYGFLDTSPVHFQNFSLDGHRRYEIEGNRRSTGAIVDLLNRVRSDGLAQSPIRPEKGEVPLVYGGSLASALTHAHQNAEGPVMVLGRTHDGVALARRLKEGRLTDDDPWERLEEANGERCRFLSCVALALDLAQRKLFDSALQRLVLGISSRKGFRKPLAYDQSVDVVRRRSLALAILNFGLGEHDSLLGKSALDMYEGLRGVLPQLLPGLKLPSVKSGKFKEVASSVQYCDLMDSLRSPDETRAMRTVHQAKGSESHTVFMILDRAQIDHVLKPSTGAVDDELRITYVGLSRARDKLLLYCPSSTKLPEFESIGLQTMIVDGPMNG